MRIFFTREAEKYLSGLDNVDQARIIKKMRWFVLQKDPMEFAVHISGHDAYRFRIGDYRIIFDLSKSEGRINVLYIDKRDKVYKDL